MVYVRGCEAKYLEPLLGSSDFCEKPPASDRRFLRESEKDENQDVMPEEPSLRTGTSPRFFASEQRKPADHAKVVHNSHRGLGGGAKRSSSDQGPHPGVTNRNLGDPYTSFGRGSKGSAGSLVIHIRSGDIFLPRNAIIMEPNFPGFGQVIAKTSVVRCLGCCGTRHVETYESRVHVYLVCRMPWSSCD